MVKTGKYRHYKGKVYEVLGVALHSETLEKYVVYRGCYEDGETWIRPFSMFLESVTVDGVSRPRFAYLEKSENDE